MEAWPTGLRPPEPLKMTSVMDSPRRFFAELSPITQRTASMTLDLPQPLGPTTAQRLPGKCTVVGSTKDLNPASLMLFRRIADSSLDRGHPCWSPNGEFYTLWPRPQAGIANYPDGPRLASGQLSVDLQHQGRHLAVHGNGTQGALEVSGGRGRGARQGNPGHQLHLLNRGQ